MSSLFNRSMEYTLTIDFAGIAGLIVAALFILGGIDPAGVSEGGAAAIGLGIIVLLQLGIVKMPLVLKTYRPGILMKLGFAFVGLLSLAWVALIIVALVKVISEIA